MKILINKCSHGFTLSPAQLELFSGIALVDIPRHNGALITSFEGGDRRGDGGSSLAIVEIPNTAHYRIVDTNGYETLYWSESKINTL